MADDLSRNVNASALFEQFNDWKTAQFNKIGNDLDSLQAQLDEVDLHRRNLAKLRPMLGLDNKQSIYVRNPLKRFKDVHSVPDGLFNFITSLADAAFKAYVESWEGYELLDCPGLAMGLRLVEGVPRMYLGIRHWSASKDANPSATHIPDVLTFVVFHEEKYPDYLIATPPRAPKVQILGTWMLRGRNNNNNNDARLRDLVPELQQCLRADREQRLLFLNLFTLHDMYRHTVQMTAGLDLDADEKKRIAEEKAEGAMKENEEKEEDKKEMKMETETEKSV
ncbi:hypothetical protein F5Y08DRAFT_342329 [Xylaria arbuscula]|nr:hypothetical protein F5Y08DRAFT_342329 [Xylaria arbuscula]